MTGDLAAIAATVLFGLLTWVAEWMRQHEAQATGAQLQAAQTTAVTAAAETAIAQAAVATPPTRLALVDRLKAGTF